MGTEHEMGKQSMMHPGAMSAVVEVMREMWELLNEEQKKEVMKIRMDVLTQWMEAEIANEEKMIEVKKNAVESIKKVQEMMK
jgi:hypothetical protein